VAQFARVLQRIEKSRGEDAAEGLEGLSGKKIISSIEHATELFCPTGSVYVEIGVFRGLTLLSNAAKNRRVPCYGIDNFSLFDEAGTNLGIVREHIKRLATRNAAIINRDFESALDALEAHIGKNKVGVLFVDGPHDYRSQLVALLKIVPYLARECAIIIDDANYPHVRQATNDFLRTHPDFALLSEAYTRVHPANMDTDEKKRAMEGWWNGAHIIVRDPRKLVRRKFARERDKNIYFASHDIFRHELAESAFDVLQHAQRLGDCSPSEEAGVVRDLKKCITVHRKKYPGLFRHQNTESDDLPAFKLYQ